MKQPPPTRTHPPCVFSLKFCTCSSLSSSSIVTVPLHLINHLCPWSPQLSSQSLPCMFSLDTLKFFLWFYPNDANYPSIALRLPQAPDSSGLLSVLTLFRIHIPASLVLLISVSGSYILLTEELPETSLPGSSS